MSFFYIAPGRTNPSFTPCRRIGSVGSQLRSLPVLIGAACGAVFGLVYTRKAGEEKLARNLSNSQSIQPTDNGKVWKDWRNFVVVRKVKESEEITSFYLKPEDKGEVPNFQPGQFLTIKLDIPGQSKPIIRTYSLSDYPQPHDYYWDGNFSNVQKIFDESGKLLEEAYIRRLDKFLKELIWMAKVLRYGRENVALE